MPEPPPRGAPSRQELADNAPCRVGWIENDHDNIGNLTGRLTIKCSCGWRVRFRRRDAHRANELALDHQLGRVETPAVAGFMPVVDLEGGE
jgi:hypothetical protein